MYKNKNTCEILKKSEKEIILNSTWIDTQKDLIIKKK